MSRAPHLLLAISGHGYGHLAQCAPVINRLADQLPGLRLTLMSGLPQAVLAGRIETEFTCIPAETDPVLCMHSAWEVDVPASRAVFQEFHQRRAALLEETRAQLRELKPDLVLANIPWLLLAAAARENIPAVALCSLNWAAVFSSYLGASQGVDDIYEQMLAGYHAADVFLAPEPALPMPELPNYRALGPIARLGTRHCTALHEELVVADSTRVVLVGLGGIETDLPLGNWPQLDDVVWVFPEAPGQARADFVDGTSLHLSMIDLLASADVVLTKPGYGTYTEAVCNGIPLLTLERPDWPETAYLNAWAQEHGNLREISLQQFNTGRYADVLASLLQSPKKTPPPPTGIQQAADLLSERLICL